MSSSKKEIKRVKQALHCTAISQSLSRIDSWLVLWRDVAFAARMSQYFFIWPYANWLYAVVMNQLAILEYEKKAPCSCGAWSTYCFCPGRQAENNTVQAYLGNRFSLFLVVPNLVISLLVSFPGFLKVMLFCVDILHNNFILAIYYEAVSNLVILKSIYYVLDHFFVLSKPKT
jgi:hypothetical protein